MTAACCRRPKPAVPYRREFLPAPDGGVVTLDWPHFDDGSKVWKCGKGYAGHQQWEAEGLLPACVHACPTRRLKTDISTNKQAINNLPPRMQDLPEDAPVLLLLPGPRLHAMDFEQFKD